MVEMEGIISNQLVSILIDPSSNLSYVSPQTVEKCKLNRVKHVKSWNQNKINRGHTSIQIYYERITDPSNLKYASFRILQPVDWHGLFGYP
jgi:hypothetical protein